MNSPPSPSALTQHLSNSSRKFKIQTNDPKFNDAYDIFWNTIYEFDSDAWTTAWMMVDKGVDEFAGAYEGHTRAY